MQTPASMRHYSTFLVKLPVDNRVWPFRISYSLNKLTIFAQECKINER
jgi:hypothetical protein